MSGGIDRYVLLNSISLAKLQGPRGNKASIATDFVRSSLGATNLELLSRPPSQYQNINFK